MSMQALNCVPFATCRRLESMGVNMIDGDVRLGGSQAILRQGDGYIGLARLKCAMTARIR